MKISEEIVNNFFLINENKKRLFLLNLLNDYFDVVKGDFGTNAAIESLKLIRDNMNA